MPPDVFVKRYFAKMYGFTEEMTDNSSVDAVTWWPMIDRAEVDVQEKRMRDEQRAAERRARR
jgi:hypothetical protein